MNYKKLLSFVIAKPIDVSNNIASEQYYKQIGFVKNRDSNDISSMISGLSNPYRFYLKKQSFLEKKCLTLILQEPTDHYIKSKIISKIIHAISTRLELMKKNI